MNTREIFQRALLEYGGTLLIVSHDRFFLDNLAERVLEIRDGGLYNYLGNYSYFIERRAEAASGDLTGDARAEAANTRERRRAEADERNRLYRKKKTFMDEIGPTEAEIAKSEKRMGEIDASLCDPDVLADSAQVRRLMLERSETEEKLARDYVRWEELSAAMEKIK